MSGIAIVGMAERILAADTSALEREIDDRVYRLYGLSKDEIKIVEDTAK